MTTPSTPDPYHAPDPQAGGTPGYPAPAGGYSAQGGYPAQSGYPSQGGPPAQGGYPQGGWSAPPGAYPATAGGLPATGQRPGTLTTAAVLAFVIGGLLILGMVLVLSVSSLVGGAYWIFAILGLIIAAGLIYGGVQLLPGKDARIIVISAGLIVVIQIINMITYFVATQLIVVVMAVLIIVFCLQSTGKDWVRSRGGKTF